MTTSTSPLIPDSREPLRLRLAEHPGRDLLDGGWWPRSRDLAVELADLVDRFPTDRPRIVRALVSPPDWSSTTRRIRIADGWLKVGSFPRDDTHVVILTTAGAGRPLLRLLVVPPELTPDQGDAALLAAADPGNAHSAADLLRTVTEHADPRG